MTRAALLIFCIILGSTGCSGDADDGKIYVPSAGVVRGTVNYNGQRTGILRIAVFASFPPRGSPLAEVAIDGPTFPQAFEVHGVQPGRHFVLAIIDADPADGDRFNPRLDPGGAHGGRDSPIAIAVDVTQGAPGVSIDLLEPDDAVWHTHDAR